MTEPRDAHPSDDGAYTDARPRTERKKVWTYALGALLLVAFAGFSLGAFTDSLTQYVSFDQAREKPRVVQVAGALADGTSRYDTSSGLLHFTLVDEASGDTLPVRYEGLKPANFEEAISIVAIGRYDADSGELAANKLLVKCPSKYQGVDDGGTAKGTDSNGDVVKEYG